MDDLGTFFGALLDELPTAEESNLVLTGENVPLPPPELETDRLVLEAMFPGAIYESTRYDSVDFFADKRSYRALGLLAFASILHARQTIIHLRHEAIHAHATQITRLVVDSTGYADVYPSHLVLVPRAFAYCPKPPDSQHPLYFDVRHGTGPGAHRTAMPQLVWSNDDELLVTPDDWSTRSVVHGFGVPSGAARLAALLLDLGLPQTDRTWVQLEGPAGYQSVTEVSAQARFWVGYDYS